MDAYLFHKELLRDLVDIDKQTSSWLMYKSHYFYKVGLNRDRELEREIFIKYFVFLQFERLFKEFLFSIGLADLS